MSEQYYVYIMTNKHNSVLYTGVTNDLQRGSTSTALGRVAASPAATRSSSSSTTK
jgi:predicted GIY-YIG superfamily endonuclease